MWDSFFKWAKILTTYLCYRNADILISEKHPIYGQEIHTQQSGGCGQPGDVIRLPRNFVEKSQKSNNSIISQSKAKLFVENWMKFRYGIFEEYGFVQDSMYPNFFYSKGNMLPTGTSNIQLGKEIYKTLMHQKEVQSAIRAIVFTDRNILEDSH